MYFWCVCPWHIDPFIYVQPFSSTCYHKIAKCILHMLLYVPNCSNANDFENFPLKSHRWVSSICLAGTSGPISQVNMQRRRKWLGSVYAPVKPCATHYNCIYRASERLCIHCKYHRCLQRSNKFLFIIICIAKLSEIISNVCFFFLFLHFPHHNMPCTNECN